MRHVRFRTFSPATYRHLGAQTSTPSCVDAAAEQLLRLGVGGAQVKGGKAGQGRRKPPAKLDPLEKQQQKQRQGPKRGDKKKDWGANEREVPVLPRPNKR